MLLGEKAFCGFGDAHGEGDVGRLGGAHGEGDVGRLGGAHGEGGAFRSGGAQGDGGAEGFGLSGWGRGQVAGSLLGVLVVSTFRQLVNFFCRVLIDNHGSCFSATSVVLPLHWTTDSRAGGQHGSRRARPRSSETRTRTLSAPVGTGMSRVPTAAAAEAGPTPPPVTTRPRPASRSPSRSSSAFFNVAVSSASRDAVAGASLTAGTCF